MGRLLGPNETNFWLLDRRVPMNLVAVLPIDPAQLDVSALARSVADFALPVVELDAEERPRWSTPKAGTTLDQLETTDQRGWIGMAQDLLTHRIGEQGTSYFRAVLLRCETKTYFLFAVPHTICDWRAILWMAQALLDGAEAGALMDACEELLPDSAYRSPDADALLDFWWSGTAARHWQAVGLNRLTQMLPAPIPTALQHHKLSPRATEALLSRSKVEGVSFMNALAIAARDVCGLSEMAISVDMLRFVDSAPPKQPGLAISHISAPLSGAAFWQAARDLRANLREQIGKGVAGDNLLALPRALKQGNTDGVEREAEAAMTSSPRGTEQLGWAVSSPRGGGFVLTPVMEPDAGLMLIAAPRPQDDPNMAKSLLDALMRAVTLP